jgi:hypothetical protein
VRGRGLNEVNPARADLGAIIADGSASNSVVFSAALIHALIREYPHSRLGTVATSPPVTAVRLRTALREVD